MLSHAYLVIYSADTVNPVMLEWNQAVAWPERGISLELGVGDR
jgi:hypothetical protein